MKISESRARWAVLVTVAGVLLLAASPAMAAGSGTWSPVPPPATPRATDHTATELLDGKVLVVGGVSAGEESKGAITTAELYDPVANRWTPAGSLGVPRQYHQATRLADGRVLVTGGYFEGKLVAAAEVFDPKTTTWNPAGAMGVARMGHTATLLPSGKVLAAGGLVFGEDARLSFARSAELFEPATLTWARVAEMPAPRAEHSATVLADGGVLLTGGQGSAGRIVAALRDALLYDPSTGAWATVPHLMRTARAAHTATLLPNGDVLIAGGSVQKEHGGGGRPTTTTERYEPKTKSFIPAASLNAARLAHTATILPDGKVLVVGGLRAEDNKRNARAVGSAEVYDPGTSRWTIVASPPKPASATPNREMRVWLLAGNHSATLLAAEPCGSRCGQVLVIGGDGPAAPVLYRPAASTSSPRAGGAATGSDDDGGRTPLLMAATAVAGLLLLGLAARSVAGRRGGRSTAQGRPRRR